VQRFYWLIEETIAGCSLPGGSPSPGVNASEQEHSEALLSDVLQLQREGIGAVLSLTEEPLPTEVLDREKIENLHLPVPDLAAPTPDQLRAALHFIDVARSHGKSVAVHCLMGQGRTGTVLAAYLIRSGIRVDDAIAQVRAICPGALSSPPQERALAAYFERRDWML
jgi:atypical dual specificity phosphatase